MRSAKQLINAFVVPGSLHAFVSCAETHHIAELIFLPDLNMISLSPIPHLLPNCSMYPFQESIALPDDSVSASVCYVPVSLVSSEMIKDSLNHAPPALDAHRIDICPERYDRQHW